MRTSLKLSSFAIAAIIIMTTAGSSFAQAQANNARAEVSASAGTPELLAMNSRRPVAGERIMGEATEVKSTSEMRSAKKSSLLSPAMFKAAGSSQFVKVDGNQFLGEEFKSAMAPVNTTSQLTEKPRKIEFVPSRGQRLPDNKVTQ